MIELIYPKSPFNPKEVEENYQQEAQALKEAGFTINLIDTDDLAHTRFAVKENTHYLYRGWMLDKDNYHYLSEKTRGQLLVSETQYLANHHLPGWYNALKNYTMPSLVTTEEKAVETFANSGWSQVFIKDYVKSLKTGIGSIARNAAEVVKVLSDMKHYRGHIEGGVVLREVMQLKPETEVRSFVIAGQLFTPYELATEKVALAHHIMEKHAAFFYSIDLTEDIHGKTWLVEIGDGQVSDYVGWNVQDFARIFTVLPELENKNSFENKKNKLK